MTNKGDGKDEARKARLAAALRANLKRRKVPGRDEESGPERDPSAD